MADVTVIYYTSNQERPNFERRIKRALLKSKGDLPLISVSQKPMALGRNVCVGRMEVCGQSALKQLYLGVSLAETEFVCTAESDCLYPPAYFEFQPTNPGIFYVIKPLWVLFAQNIGRRQWRRCGTFGRKTDYGELSAMHVGRDTLLRRIEFVLDNWGRRKPHLCVLQPAEVEKQIVDMPQGVITFKTDQNMHRFTMTISASQTPELPYWGSGSELVERYLGIINHEIR